jgi:hypothetical protein
VEGVGQGSHLKVHTSDENVGRVESLGHFELILTTSHSQLVLLCRNIDQVTISCA